VAATLPLVTYAPHLAPELLALAATQRGVFTGEQARAAGHSQNEIQRLRRHRHLVSVRRGAYALREAYEGAEAPEKHRMAVAALSLVLTAPAVLSHETAAVELGLELLQPDLSLLHVARPEAAGSREEAGVKHHCAELPEDQVVRRGGELDLTVLARTAVDVARETDRFECAWQSSRTRWCGAAAGPVPGWPAAPCRSPTGGPRTPASRGRASSSSSTASRRPPCRSRCTTRTV
jgi:hypothetical protein